MKKYKVEVYKTVQVIEVYEFEAADAEEAGEMWYEHTPKSSRKRREDVDDKYVVEVKDANHE